MISGGRNLISIWFFIGVLVLAYGVLITGWALFVKPGHTWVLQELRADLWWGVLMTAIGAFYTVRFRPGRK
jgi:hypothetical protein